MNNHYRKLKLSILLQTVFVTALTVLVGGFILEYLIDGVYNDSFANIFVQFLTSLHVSEKRAVELYWMLIGHNKEFFMILGFLALFALFFYVALTKMTKYLRQVEVGIENILSDSTEPIHLITELAPLEERLNEIKNTLKRQEQEALENEQKKNDLVLFLAHDLKTPLTSVVAYLSMLDSYPDMPKEERARYTHISLEKATRLGELIQEFFEITRFNLQDITLEKTELNLTMMLEQIADELYGVLQEKHLTCQVDAAENLVVKGDPDKLARVFDNILRNAIVYCKSDSELTITAVGLKEGVEIIFENEGHTISPENLERIFDKFYRADAARQSRTGGAGLGLAIAKEIVELHGGKIGAESEEGKTRFIVNLPYEKGEKKDEVHAHGRRPSRGKPRRRKSIHRAPGRRTLG
ncbi:ATP-binding protein [Roseburia hominis]